MGDIATIIQEELKNLPENQWEDQETGISATKENPDAQTAVPYRFRIISQIVRKPGLLHLIFAGLFLLIALAMIPDLIPREECSEKDRIMILVRAGAYLICGIPFLLIKNQGTAFIIMNILYMVILIGESVIRLREKHSPDTLLFRIMLILLAAANLIFFCKLPFFALAYIALRAFTQILLIAFSQIRLKVLRKIIRKTYAAEILLGMCLLIIAFSILLSMFDDGVKSFWEAMWFCFATVTTIGYGGVAVTSNLGRILGIILGIYGIVVVALVTSIIVNFYNEMTSDKADETDQSGKESGGQ